MVNSFIESNSSDINVKRRPSRASRACERCRLRKIKCDGNLAGCNKCLAKKLECIYKDRSAAFQPNLTSRLKFFTPEIENTEITRRKFSYSTKLNSYPLYQSISEPSLPFNLLDLKHQLNEVSSAKQFKIVPYSHETHSKKLIARSRTAPSNSSINYLDFNMIKLASRTARTGLSKYELLTLYPSGRFEVQGFTPIGYMFTNASFLECLTNEDQILCVFNSNLARSSTFNLPALQSPTLSHKLNLSWQTLVKTLCMEYFKRIHLSYPILDPEHFLKLLDEYRLGLVNIHEGSWPYFGFLVNVVCLVTVSIVPSLTQYHEIFEMETKKSIQKYFKIPHTFICQALFLLRTFPKLQDKNSKWIRINHIAIRMSMELGCMSELSNSKNIVNNRALKIMNLRIGLIAHFIDLVAISAINSSPQLLEEMFSNSFFTLPLNHPYLHQQCQLDGQKPCKFNTDEYFPQCKHHDFTTLRLLIEIGRVYYTITKFNNSIIIYLMNNPSYIRERLVESIELEKIIQNIFKNIPSKYNTNLREFKLIEILSKFRSVESLIGENVLITELPKKSQKFTIYIHLWLYFNLITIFEKLSKFDFIWSPTNNEEELIRKYCAKRCLLSAIKVSQLIWVIGDHFNSYLLNNKYLMISKSCLILSRALIAYNAESVKHNIQPIKSVQIHQNRNFDYPFSGLQNTFISLEEPLIMANNFNIDNLLINLEFLTSVIYYYSKDLPLSKEVLLTLREYLKQNGIEINL